MYNVLLVDDESIFLDYLECLLDWQDYGCRICGRAYDGKHAWEIIEQNRPEIIFLDINIPEPDGLEICRRIREANIPSEVIIVSAHDDFLFAKTAFQNGIVDYILKPFGKEEVTDVLERCFSRLRTERSKILSECLAGYGQWIDSCAVVVVRCERTEEDHTLVLDALISAIERSGMDCWAKAYGKELVFAVKTGGNYDGMVHVLERYAGEGFVMAVSDDCTTPSAGLKQARSAMENRALSHGKIILYKQMSVPTGSMCSQATFTRLIGSLENKNSEETTLLIRSLFGLDNTTGISFQYFLSVYSSLILYMARHYGKNRKDAEMLLSQQNDILEELTTATSISDLTVVIENAVYELYSDCIQITVPTRRGELVEKINRYIQENYSQIRLTADKISADLGYESSYMRRVYKSETGTTILRALEDYRILKAKQLLSQRKMRHAEIAKAVGFGDQYYFSKRFKQIVGYTPTEYEVMNSNVE